MRAAVFHGAGDVRVEQVPDPGAPAPDEVILEVSRAAICGSDAAEFSHGPEMVPLHHRHPASGHQGPTVLGHEFVGIVSRVGDEVEGVEVGDRVVPGATDWCGECDWCRVGRINLCRDRYLVGMHRDGGLAEQVAVPAKMCRPVAEHCTDDAAAIAQPLAVAMHGIERAEVGEGPVVVIGAGGIGSFVIAAAASRGAEVLAIDISPAKLRTAEVAGAAETILADDPGLTERVADLNGGEGPAVVIEASGAPSAPAMALDLVRRGGTILLLGMQAQPRELDLWKLAQSEIDLVTSNAHVCDRNLAPALALLADTDLAERVIGDRIGLDELVVRGLAPLSEGTAPGKIVVDPRR